MSYRTKIQSKPRESVSPLALWRKVPADEIGIADLGGLHAALRRIDLAGESAWRLARVGDAGAAIGVAIRVAIKRRAAPEIVDLVMTAVLAAAIEGSAAARAFLAHMLEKRGAPVLAASWVEANRVAALAKPQPVPASAAPSSRRLGAQAARASR